MSHHDRFDLKRWASEFTRDRIVEDELRLVEDRERRDGQRFASREEKVRHATEWALAGNTITGPRHVITLERLRYPHNKAGTLGVARATDVFVWGLGEPKVRSQTKIAGLPYRPSDRPWPVGDNNDPSLFLGQICFADSLDLVRDVGPKVSLPGDVLLIFSLSRELSVEDWNHNQNALQFEWWPMGLEKLVERGQIPDQRQGPRRELLAPMYSHIHRTADFPDVGEDHPLRQNHMEGDRHTIIDGTKIGGVNTPFPEYDELPGHFLAQMGSVFTTHTRHPLLNVDSAESLETSLKKGQHDILMFGDLGGLYLFVEQSGLFRKRIELRWILPTG
jgi:hypothetical protein